MTITYLKNDTGLTLTQDSLLNAQCALRAMQGAPEVESITLRLRGGPTMLDLIWFRATITRNGTMNFAI